MYKKQLYHIAPLIFTIILAFGCTETDLFPGEDDINGDCKGAYVSLAFEMPSLPEVELRAQEPTRESEEAVSDLYMIVFDANGNRVSGISRFYSKTDLALTHPFTTGTLNNILLPKGKNTIYLIANSESSYNMDITPDSLDAITTQDQLKDLEVRFINIHQAPSNRGVRNNILMWGYTNVTVACGMTTNVKIYLRSIESKVRFRVFLHPDRTDSLEVVLSSYSVENIPRRGLVVADRSLTFTYENREEDMYNIASREFDVPEDLTITRNAPDTGEPATLIGDFYYYQMENSQVPTKIINTGGISKDAAIKLRGKLLKNADGTNVGEIKSNKPSFEYAPQMCTFARIKAVVKDKSRSNYYADTYYYVPLGHDPNDPNNYNVKGNYAYTYNIFIKGVTDIIVEADVEGKNRDIYQQYGYQGGEETNPLTEGFVFYDAEEIIVDAHYANVDMTIPAEAIQMVKDSTMTISYVVNTPFDNSYISTKGIVDIYWITFAPIPKDNNMLVPYPGDTATIHNPDKPLIRVDQLNDFIKNSDLTAYTRADGSVRFTAFVDEFFYDSNPITGGPVNYGDFTNRPPRGMAIYTRFCKSHDGQSRLFRNNVFHLRQNSIWTIFSKASAEVVSGYGIEVTDETPVFSKPRSNYSKIVYNDVKNVNGRYNMLNVWAKTDGTNWKITFNADGTGNSLWKFKTVPTRSNTSNIMLLEDGDPTYTNEGAPENQWVFFSDGRHDTGAFACLQRNRDNNGNGIIDKDEVKWYLPSYNQILNTYIGKAVIPDKYWFHHLRSRNTNAGERYRETWLAISSPKKGSNGYIGTYWSDEGISFGNDAAYNVRCFRNLPKDIVKGDANESIPTGTDFGYIAKLQRATPGEPAYIKVSRKMDPTSYRARFVGSGPLPVPHYYRDAANSLTYDFYVAKQNISAGHFQSNYNNFTKGIDPCDSYSEAGVTGWRTPNQVELALIYLIDQGELGTDANGNSTVNAFGATSYAYAISISEPLATTIRHNSIEVNETHIREINWNLNANQIRCVKDRHPTD